MNCNVPSTHPFHDIAKPGDTINWGEFGDEYSSTLKVGYDNQLTWANPGSMGDPEAGKARYAANGRELIRALYAGQMTVAEYAEVRYDLVGDYVESQAWDWGDATPALDAYAREMD
jgi:hypothetical protein